MPGSYPPRRPASPSLAPAAQPRAPAQGLGSGAPVRCRALSWGGESPQPHTLLCFRSIRDWPNQEAHCWEAGQELTYLLLPAAASSTRLRSCLPPRCSGPRSHAASPSRPWGHPGVTGAWEWAADPSGTWWPPQPPSAREAGGGAAILSAPHRRDPQLRGDASPLGNTLRPPHSPRSCRLRSPGGEQRCEQTARAGGQSPTSAWEMSTFSAPAPCSNPLKMVQIAALPRAASGASPGTPRPAAKATRCAGHRPPGKCGTISTVLAHGIRQPRNQQAQQRWGN